MIQPEHPVLVVQETRIDLQERDQIEDSVAVEILIAVDLIKKNVDLIAEAVQIVAEEIELNQEVEEIRAADLGVEKIDHRAAGVVPKDLLVAGVKEIEIPVPVMIAILVVAADLIAEEIQIEVDLIKKRMFWILFRWKNR